MWLSQFFEDVSIKMKPPTSYLLHLTVLLYNTSLFLRTIFYAKALLSATQQHFKSGSNDIIIAVVNIKILFYFYVNSSFQGQVRLVVHTVLAIAVLLGTE